MCCVVSVVCVSVELCIFHSSILIFSVATFLSAAPHPFSPPLYLITFILFPTIPHCVASSSYSFPSCPIIAIFPSPFSALFIYFISDLHLFLFTSSFTIHTSNFPPFLFFLLSYFKPYSPLLPFTSSFHFFLHFIYICLTFLSSFFRHHSHLLTHSLTRLSICLLQYPHRSYLHHQFPIPLPLLHFFTPSPPFPLHPPPTPVLVSRPQITTFSGR